MSGADSLLWGTPRQRCSRHNGQMWRMAGWGDGELRIPHRTSPTMLIAVSVVLALGAAIESITRAVAAEDSAQFAAVLCLLALGGTVPLASMPRVWAAATICASNLLALVPFHDLTV